MFDDDDNWLNDDGYPLTNDTGEVPQEWLDEEEAYWSGRELDPADSGEYDPVTGDAWDHDDESDEEVSADLDYDGYNDPEDY